jgi:hypothetical protein
MDLAKAKRARKIVGIAFLQWAGIWHSKFFIKYACTALTTTVAKSLDFNVFVFLDRSDNNIANQCVCQKPELVHS